jgi:hypothetical protein
MAYRLFATAIVMGLALVILTACSSAGPAHSPTAPLLSATLVQPAQATKALLTPERTFAVIETLVPEETVGEAMKPTPEVPYLANLVQQAQQDLARRLDIPIGSIEFLEFEDVVWPDGSLGCPMPGMAYTQVLVEGYRILLQYEDQVYAYHGGGSRPPFLCQNPQK